jgi:tRNA A-37 threonylcarbamoyl transferase component Bud32
VAARPRIEIGGVRWWLGRGADRGATDALLRAALEALHSGAARDLKTGRRKQLYPLDLRGGGAPDHLLKVNDYRGAAGLRRALRGSKARHELEMAERVAARGIPTALPLAAGERRSGGLLRSCYLLMPILEEVVDLRRLWWEEKESPRERHALVAAFGALSRQVHDAGVFQGDFAPNNFLVRRGPSPQLFMIDFERVQQRGHNDEAARCFMLAKIDRRLAGASAAERMRFLRAYSAGDRAEVRRWWDRVEHLAPRLALGDFQRMTRNATRPGRRFRRLAHGAWRGYARRDVDDAPLYGVLAESRALGDPLRVEGPAQLWRVDYGGLRRPEAKRVWATANFLWDRGGLCPKPVALCSRGDHTVLLLERRAEVQLLPHCPERRKGLAAVRILLDRILAWGEIQEPLLPESLLIESRDGSAPRASLVAPAGVRVTGKAGGDRRARASELLDSLGG